MENKLIFYIRGGFEAGTYISIGAGLKAKQGF